MIAFLEDGLAAHLSATWYAAWDIWLKGGWAMIAIAFDAVLLFGVGTHVFLRLRRKGSQRVHEKTWRLWLQHAELREGELGRLFDIVSEARTLDESATVFAGLRQTELAPSNRDLKVMRVCIAAAPLFGLLGTVTGMLATFGALATGAGGDKTMEAVSRGISEALITTETGLVVALPGMFLHYALGRMRDFYAAFLTHLETVCAQDLYRSLESGARAA